MEYLVVARAQAGLDHIEAAEAAAETGLTMKPGKRMRNFFEQTLKEL